MGATEQTTQQNGGVQQFISGHPLLSIAIMTGVFFIVMVVLAYATITVVG